MCYYLIALVDDVAQAQSLYKGSLAEAVANGTDLSLVVLRVCENKFTSRSATDTSKVFLMRCICPDCIS
jgi:hypothetical protein